MIDVVTNITSLFSHLDTRSGSSAWEMQEAQDSFHQSAAAGTGKSVQAQQVPVQTQTLRGGHLTHADRDPGQTTKF